MKKENQTYHVMILIILFFLLPIVIAGIYNHPSVDDYSYSYLTYQTVKQNGNVFELLQSALKTSKIFMETWQGLYTSAVILALQPGIFGEKFYGLTTLIVLIILFLGIDILFKTIYQSIFKVKNKKHILLTFFVLFYLVETIPSTVQGLYWYNGSMNYLFFFSLLLIQLAGLIRYSKEGKRGSIIVSTIIAFLLSGGNHVTAFAGILISIMFVIYLFIKKKVKLAILPLMAGIVGFVINLTAPGTAVRSSQITYQGSIIKTICNTAFHSFLTMNSWFNFSLMLFLIVMSILMFDEIKKLKINIKTILLLMAIQYIILAGMMCVPYYAMGSFGEPRLTNVLYFSFIFMSLSIFVLFISYLYNRYFVNYKFTFHENLITLFFILAIGWIGFFGKEHTTTVKSMHQLMNGTLKEYSEQINQRVKQYEDEKLQDIVVEELTVKPSLLFFDDITEDEEDWRNNAVEQYYNKKSIIVEINQKNNKEKVNG